MSKPRFKSTESANNSASDPIEAVAVDSALKMFRDMLLEEYTRRIADGGDPDSVKEALAKQGVRFEMLFKGIPKNAKLLEDRVGKELAYITNNYYNLFASYRKLSATLDVLYAYSNINEGMQYKDDARRYLEPLEKLAPGEIYDEQASLRKQAMDVLKGIIEGAPIVDIRDKSDDEINAASVLSTIARKELEELKRHIGIITGYIDTYKRILEMTLRELDHS
ncbi:MAG: hypothetical protein QXW10_00255 [Candidatus Micrarchaeaceae archaeon]